MEQKNAVGRRKTAIARVYLRKGKGNMIINGRDVTVYFPVAEHVLSAQSPLVVTNSQSQFDILVNVKGGGQSAQSCAIRHGLSRALVKESQDYYSTLRAEGYLTRDARMVERKKYGQRGARKKFQFSKR